MKLLVTQVEFDFDDGFIPLTKYEEDNIWCRIGRQCNPTIP